MATLIPTLGACVSRMTGGEKRLAERLEQKLDAEDGQNHTLSFLGIYNHGPLTQPHAK